MMERLLKRLIGGIDLRVSSLRRTQSSETSTASTDDDSLDRADRFLGVDDDGTQRIETAREFSEWARSPFERDRDRILYTREFRRLKDVTQVARAGESYLYHDRMSHSLKVGQIGRRLAELVLRRREQTDGTDEPYTELSEVLDPDVVETACLAHDTGHPPFGHLSEETLDDLVRNKTRDNPDDNPDIGYEGNAQSFRIVSSLATSGVDGTGLGLTRATLNAIQKYPHSRAKNDNKWGYYETERKAFDFARGLTPDGRERSLEAEIMDYADDVTYAIHDVTDFYKGGHIPLDKLLSECTEREKYRAHNTSELNRFSEHIDRCDFELRKTSVKSLFRGLADRVQIYADDQLFTPFHGTTADRTAVDQFTSKLIGRYLDSGAKTNPDSVRIEFGANGYHLHVDRAIKEQIWILRELTKFYVITDSTLMAQQRGQQRLIRELFDALYEETSRDDLSESAIPEPYREWLKADNTAVPVPENFEVRRARVVADMITTMTEPQAISLHKRLTGDTPGSLQDEIIR